MVTLQVNNTNYYILFSNYVSYVFILSTYIKWQRIILMAMKLHHLKLRIAQLVTGWALKLNGLLNT